MERANNRQPLILKKHTTFPTFQMFAYAGKHSALAADDVFKICILTTLAWLREKLDEVGGFEEINLPGPGEYQRVSADAFVPVNSALIGYDLNIETIPEQKAWALQLKEPDQGISRMVDGALQYSRYPVVGRMIETNIAFCVANGVVECGFKTIVTEPEGTEERPEVFRYAIIKTLIRNPLVGLSDAYPFVEQMIPINDIKKTKKLASWLSNPSRRMPAVVLAEYREEAPDLFAEDDLFVERYLERIPLPKVLGRTPGIVAGPLEFPEEQRPFGLSVWIEIHKAFFPDAYDERSDLIPKRIQARPDPNEKVQTALRSIEKTLEKALEQLPPKPDPAADLSAQARHLVGFAHFFALSDGVFEEFRKNLQDCAMEPSGMAIYTRPPLIREESAFIVPRERIRENEEFFKPWADFLYSFPIGEEYDFGHCRFVADIRALSHHLNAEKINSVYQTKQEVAEALEQSQRKCEELEKQYQDFQKEITAGVNKQLKSLQFHNAQLTEGLEAQKKDSEKEIADLKRQLFLVEERLQWHERMENRPVVMAEVASWVEKEFPGRLLLLPRAKQLLSETKNTRLDLVWKALAFLGMEYYDMQVQLISEEEAKTRASYKYQRWFDVTPISEEIIRAYPREYKVHYSHNPFTGKKKEVGLNLHLRSGVDSENLVRIYFLWDGEKKLVVIGSLPDHLPPPN
ncbi:MAG: DUF3450 domain-containing protein [Fusobacteriaceae bacterium]|jgi:hypothetical protein|nr:DUF3450 domain-containing protein [Fusobacteriaceae bacterium]